jgi:hypothetical protein
VVETVGFGHVQGQKCSAVKRNLVYLVMAEDRDPVERSAPAQTSERLSPDRTTHFFAQSLRSVTMIHRDSVQWDQLLLVVPFER